MLIAPDCPQALRCGRCGASRCRSRGKLCLWSWDRHDAFSMTASNSRDIMSQCRCRISQRHIESPACGLHPYGESADHAEFQPRIDSISPWTQRKAGVLCMWNSPKNYQVLTKLFSFFFIISLISMYTNFQKSETLQRTRMPAKDVNTHPKKIDCWKTLPSTLMRKHPPKRKQRPRVFAMIHSRLEPSELGWSCESHLAVHSISEHIVCARQKKLSEMIWNDFRNEIQYLTFF